MSSDSEAAMINGPLVSVVIPVFDGEKYIAETIKSVLAQTYRNWELIIVDDGSQDSTKEIVKHFIDKRTDSLDGVISGTGFIRMIELRGNSGAARARNAGIKVARGKYLTFLDADDLWSPEKLEKQVEFMQKNDCAFSFTGYEFADAAGQPNGKKVLVPTTITYRQALRNTTIWTSTVMFDMRKLSIDDVKMPDVASEDTATWWKVLKKVGRAYGLNEVLSLYRRSGGTLSSNKIVAIRRIWNLYRKIEKLNIVNSFMNFAGYAFNAVKRRV